jgi:ABC-type antimicrobial peptide transport system permease subunit
MSHHSQVKCAAHSSVNFGAKVGEVFGPFFHRFFGLSLENISLAGFAIPVQFLAGFPSIFWPFSGKHKFNRVWDSIAILNRPGH